MSGFDINHTTISGNLTRDPELRTPTGAQPVCSIRIAHNERYKNTAGDWADRAQYFDVTIWGGLGEWVAGNVASGDKVVVAGRLRWREWEKDGTKRSRVSIEADSIVPVPKGAKDTSTAPAPTPAGDEDIPF